MKVRHDKEADAMLVIFNEGTEATHQAVTDGIIVNLDENNRIVSLELLAVSKVVDAPNILEYIDFTNPRYYAGKTSSEDLAKLLEKQKNGG
jgi:uncharacterized protein YuzE